MAKRSHRRAVRHEKEHLGCMWGLINIFDFRHGRTNQKLLSDRRRSNRHAVGAGNSRNKLDVSTFEENHQGNSNGEENGNAAAAGSKPSVKKLIEEEMINEEDNKKDIKNAEVNPKISESEQGNHKKKTCRRMKRLRKKSCDSIQDLDDSESIKSEQTCNWNHEHQFAGSLEMDNLMEEFCNYVHMRSISKETSSQHGEPQGQLNQNNPDFEEKLREAIKLLVTEKLVKGKHLMEDDFSKELVDALEILGSDGELLIKELQDQNSLLTKCFKNSDINVESRTAVGSDFLDREIGNLGHSDSKHRRFFRRMVKSQEKKPSTENKTEASNRIVVLKPGPRSLHNATESSIHASPESRDIIRSRRSSERMSSHFFFAEIKRKLKNAMGKEHHRIGSNGILGEREKGTKENIGMNSPNKDHFFMEKISRPVSVKKRDGKSSKLKDVEICAEHKISDLPKEKVSNIYIEAKKHLSEILSNEDENLDSPKGHVPKSLGRILSLPEYSVSPLGSPERYWGNGCFVTAQTRFSDVDKLQEVNENVSSTKQLSFCDNNKESNIEDPKLTSDASSEQICDNKVEESSSTGEEINDKGDVEIVEGNEIVAEEESKVLEDSHEISISLGIEDDDQISDEFEIIDVQRYLTGTKQELSEEKKPPSSRTTSPPNSNITKKKAEGQENPIDVLEHRSPVSVLEPLFADDDISPARTRSNSVEMPMQPLRIQFEEYNCLTATQSMRMKSSEEKDLVFGYVKAVLQTSGFNWHELCIKSLSTDQLLDPSLSNEVEFIPTQLCCEGKLLFDCINEVLVEVCGRYFGCSPWVSFTKPNIRPIPNMKTALYEVYEGVLWHLVPLPLPRTLDQIVRKDMAKSGTWMDLRFDFDGTGIEIGEIILEELMENTILSCVNENLELEESKNSIMGLEM